MSGSNKINGMGAAGATPSFDQMKVSKQLFGAQVVKSTLDYMNGSDFGAGNKNSDYDFQTKVLEAGIMAKGLNIAGKV